MLQFVGGIMGKAEHSGQELGENRSEKERMVAEARSVQRQLDQLLNFNKFSVDDFTEQTASKGIEIAEDLKRIFEELRAGE